MFPEKFKIIAVTGSAQGHSILRGHMRYVSLWVNIVISVEVNCLYPVCERYQQ